MSAYSEKLTDPRWQKLRLQVFDKAGWKCQVCRDTQTTLHVHHLTYHKVEPWETPIECLESLCEDCHEWREKFNSIFGRGNISTYKCQQFIAFYGPIFQGKTKYTPSNQWWPDEVMRLCYEHQEEVKASKLVPK